MTENMLKHAAFYLLGAVIGVITSQVMLNHGVLVGFATCLVIGTVSFTILNMWCELRGLRQTEQET